MYVKLLLNRHVFKTKMTSFERQSERIIMTEIPAVNNKMFQFYMLCQHNRKWFSVFSLIHSKIYATIMELNMKIQQHNLKTNGKTSTPAFMQNQRQEKENRKLFLSTAQFCWWKYNGITNLKRLLRWFCLKWVLWMLLIRILFRA